MQSPGIDIEVILVRNFIKISETIAEISHLIIFFNGIVLNFLKFDILNNCYAQDSWYVSSCKISSKLVKSLQWYRKRLNILLVWHENGYLDFFHCFGVKNSRKLNLSALSSLYECSDLELKLQWLICIVTPNFIKISETIAEISHLTIF